MCMFSLSLYACVGRGEGDNLHFAKFTQPSETPESNL